MPSLEALTAVNPVYLKLASAAGAASPSWIIVLSCQGLCPGAVVLFQESR